MAACAGHQLPDGQGLGVTSFDSEAPAGARTWTAPDLDVGQYFVFLNADVDRLAFQVTQKSDDGYVMTSEAGEVLHLTRELGDVRRELPNEASGVLVKDPPDIAYHWPLWAGKRWSCHYLRKVPGLPAQAIALSYQCDAVETIEVPAGRFECLRIWRKAGIATEEAGARLTSVLWYAPEVGFWVRRLRGGMLTELVEYSRP